MSQKSEITKLIFGQFLTKSDPFEYTCCAASICHAASRAPPTELVNATMQGFPRTEHALNRDTATASEVPEDGRAVNKSAWLFRRPFIYSASENYLFGFRKKCLCETDFKSTKLVATRRRERRNHHHTRPR